MPGDLHPQIQAMLDRAQALGIPKVQDLSTEQARALVENLSAARARDYPAPDIMDVENASTGPGYGHVPVRIYRATDSPTAPVIVFFHGGGHVLASLDSYETTARFLALSAHCTVVSVDYRMGPEYPFPAAVEDVFNATRWVADTAGALRIDSTRLCICGDSAGGNLAAVTALLARDSGAVDIAAQVLIYPVIDYLGGTPSYEKYGQGYGGLEAATAVWFRDRYLPDAEDHGDWRAAPWRAQSHSRLPPALVVMAECDILADEGHDYARRLSAAGVETQTLEFKGMTHGFFGYLGLVDDAARAHRAVAEFLRGIWG
tara:strand:- start:123 stop:1070 length:948 start_codon:yes stop_codon:yes gene_type:complete